MVGGDDHKQKLLVVAGPTASGKSVLAMRFASHLGGEIVSSDSVQIYRGLDIGSAKPSRRERESVQHHLIDCCDPSSQFNTAQYVNLANEAINSIRTRKRSCIIAGGSTLYLTHLLHGFADNPSPDQALRAELEKLNDQELKDRLHELDPSSARRIHLHDRVRLIRAIESSHLIGRQASSIVAEHNYQQITNPALVLVLVWQRDQLYRRIDLRTQRMVDNGLVDETRGLVKRYGSSLRALQSLGYREAVALLEGKLDAGELVPEIAKNTRRYAKRQLTFWRNEPSKRRWNVRPRADEKARYVDLEGKAAGRKLKPLAVYDFSYEQLLRLVNDELEDRTNTIKVIFVSSLVVEECEAEILHSANIYSSPQKKLP